jgi:hypothetical protein
MAYVTTDEMLVRLKGYDMTDAERERQAVSCAFGNLRLDKPGVTREVVELAAAKLRERRGG